MKRVLALEGLILAVCSLVCAQDTGDRVVVPARNTNHPRKVDASLLHGSITVKAPKSVKVGHKLVLTGQLPGGYIPAQGVALRVYYTEKGARGTGDYPATYHTSAKGTFTIKEPSRRSARGHIYTFWVQVVTPSPWPYQGATSKKLTVRFK